MLPQEALAERPRKQLPSRGMLLGVRHREDARSVELLVPFGLVEAGAYTVDFAEGRGVVDGDFGGGDAYYGPVEGVQVVHVVDPVAGYDGEFEA